MLFLHICLYIICGYTRFTPFNTFLEKEKKVLQKTKRTLPQKTQTKQVPSHLKLYRKQKRSIYLLIYLNYNSLCLILAYMLKMIDIYIYICLYVFQVPIDATLTVQVQQLESAILKSSQIKK